LEPSAAERARTIVAGASRGMMVTIGVEPAGYPFASVVNLVIDDEGRPLTYLSTMAEHTKNVLADARASVLVAEDVQAGADPLAAGRVTLIGELRSVAIAGARERFLARHPEATYIDYGDFGCYRLDIKAVRWVGGFGRMDWVEPGSYAAASPDPLREVAPSAIGQINADHADALVAVCRVLGGAPDVTAAVVVRLDRYGLDLVAEAATGQRTLRIGFCAPLTDVKELRQAMIDLTQRAWSAAPGSLT
jgi:heme iron utilization protein